MNFLLDGVQDRVGRDVALHFFQLSFHRSFHAQFSRYLGEERRQFCKFMFREEADL